MGVRGSIGRGTRLKHSTGMEWDELEKAKKKYTPIKHSTGESSSIRHSTGTEMDWRALHGESEDDGEATQKGKMHSIPAKAQEDTTYLDLYLESKRRGASAGDKAVTDKRGETTEGEEESGKKVSKEQFKTISLEY